MKLKFRPSSVEGKEGTLYYQVTHRRAVRTVRTDYHVHPWEWNARLSTVRVIGPDARQAHLRMIRSKVRWEKRKFLSVIMEWERMEVDYTVEDIVERFHQLPVCKTLFCFIREEEAIKVKVGRLGTAKTYRDVLRSFSKFRGGEDILLAALDWEVIDTYEAWLRSRGIRRNSTSCYMRTLRTLYLKAVEKGLTEDKKVFRHAFTGFAKTAKRAMSLSGIRSLQRLELPKGHTAAFARDIFLLSFYLRGMSFVDIAYLRKADLRDGKLSYVRRKTGQALTVKWEEPMRKIIASYAHLTGDTPFLLPIITKADGTERRQYECMEQKINRHLKAIARLLDFPFPLTTYVARHTWASAARDLGCPLQVISEGMGHDNLRTTQIYLSTIDSDAVDEMNRRIMREVLR